METIEEESILVTSKSKGIVVFETESCENSTMRRHTTLKPLEN